MSLLSGGLTGLFGAAFSAAYDDGKLVRVIRAPDGKGGWSETRSEPLPCKVHRPSMFVGQRTIRAGERDKQTSAPANTVEILVLCHGVPERPRENDLIVYDGLYRVRDVKPDGANTHWNLTCEALKNG